MFKPRHGYRSPVTHRYRGNAKGCPIFSKLDEITSDMVEDHDECLECLAKLKNRFDIYKNLAENNKPSNAVIKSLQKLSSSSSNNRLKTCLQFLIIKVNENNSSTKPMTSQTNDQFNRNRLATTETCLEVVNQHSTSTTTPTNKLRSRAASLTFKSQATRRFNHRSMHNSLEIEHQSTYDPLKYMFPNGYEHGSSEQQSPTHAQVSSSQDGIAMNCLDNNKDYYKDDSIDEDIEWHSSALLVNSSQEFDENNTNNDDIGNFATESEDNNNNDTIDYDYGSVNSHYYYECQSEVVSATETTGKQLKDCSTSTDNIAYISATKTNQIIFSQTQRESDAILQNKRDAIPGELALQESNGEKSSNLDYELRHNGDKCDYNDDESMQSCLSSSNSTSTCSSSSSSSSSVTCCSCSTSDTTNSTRSHESSCEPGKDREFIGNGFSYEADRTMQNNGSSNVNDCDTIYFRQSKLSLNDKLLDNIRTKPIQFKRTRQSGSKKSHQDEKHLENASNDINFIDVEYKHVFQEKPNFFQSKQLVKSMITDQILRLTKSQASSTNRKNACNSLASSFTSPTTHSRMGQPPIGNNNNLTDGVNCTSSKSVDNNNNNQLLECSICGIREKSTNVCYLYGPISCPICARYFGSFLRRPKELFCAQDGNCLMTFDSRCRACWIKLCLQKFDLSKEQRNTLDNFPPKLLSDPNVSLL